MVVEFTGYTPELEEKDKLHETALKFDFGSLLLSSDSPLKYDPTDWWVTENQGPVGRCGGMAAASVSELCYKLQTNRVIQFNGHYSYIRAQQKSNGLFGRDSGSTITGNVRAGKENGFCPLDWDKDGRIDYPMPPRYTTDIPQQADVMAAKYKIKFHTMLNEGFDAILHFLRLGQGGVMVGGPWGNWGPNSQGLVERFNPGGGGHAWAILGWDLTRTMFNQDVLIMYNSHGTRWGINGKAYLTKQFTNSFVSHRWSEAAGMSDLTTPEPRNIDWEKQWLLV